MPYEDELQIERMFYEDVRDKKVTARGIHNRALRKKGFRGGVRFPSDSLSTKEKKQLNGKVVTYNLFYEGIPPYEDFKKNLTTEQKIQAMNYWLNVKHYDKNYILEQWGVDVKKQQHYFYDTLRRLRAQGLQITEEAMPGLGRLGRKAGSKTKDVKVVDTVTPPKVAPVVEHPVVEYKVPEPRLPETVFTIALADTHGIGGGELAERLENIALIVNKGKKYIAHVELKELREG